MRPALAAGTMFGVVVAFAPVLYVIAVGAALIAWVAVRKGTESGVRSDRWTGPGSGPSSGPGTGLRAGPTTARRTLVILAVAGAFLVLWLPRSLGAPWLALSEMGVNDPALGTPAPTIWGLSPGGPSAVAWAGNLSYYDGVRDVTWDDWRLPTTVQPDAGCSQQEGGGAFAAGTGCTASELGHMFYEELGGTALSSILVSTDPDVALFSNFVNNGYWSETAFDGTFAWVVNYEYGAQAADNKSLGYYAWAVRDGDVGVIPEPRTAWLLGTGLLMLGLGRSRRADRTTDR